MSSTDTYPQCSLACATRDPNTKGRGVYTHGLTWQGRLVHVRTEELLASVAIDYELSWDPYLAYYSIETVCNSYADATIRSTYDPMR